MARINGLLGSVDANQGDDLLGWDTDQMPTNIYITTLAMYEILLNGGLDAFAHGLLIAHRLLESRELEDFIAERYKSYTSGIGEKIVKGEVGFKELSEYAMANQEIKLTSGRQELLETILNRYMFE